MTVTVGRVRADPLFDVKLVAMGHNTIRGAAGASVLNAELLVATGLVDSRGAARRTVAEGGAYLNNQRVSDAEARPAAEDLLPGGWLVLRRGKKSFAGVRVA